MKSTYPLVDTLLTHRMLGAACRRPAHVADGFARNMGAAWRGPAKWHARISWKPEESVVNTLSAK